MAKHGMLPGLGRRRVLQLLVLPVLAMLPMWVDARPQNTDWALVNTSARTMTVYAADGRRIAEYANIALGSGGVAAVHFHGDHTTPRGSYRIIRIRPSRNFGTFYQIDYPTAGHAEQAMRSGRLTTASGEAIIAAVEAGRLPPQTTALGGAIGIHGVGSGSLKIHKTFNWTNGCVALTNEQLRHFARFAAVGMRVIIE